VEEVNFQALLLDSSSDNATNTHPRLGLVAAESLLRMRAKRVIVAEGLGRQQDTQLVLSARVWILRAARDLGWARVHGGSHSGGRTRQG
jgi:hypothetical protein